MKTTKQGRLAPDTPYTPAMHARAVEAIHHAVTQSGAKHVAGLEELTPPIGMFSLGNEVHEQVTASYLDDDLPNLTEYPETTHPHGHVPSERARATLGKNAVSTEESSRLIAKRATEWVEANIKSVMTVTTHHDETDGFSWESDEFEWDIAQLDDPFLLAHHEEVLLAAIKLFGSREPSSMIGKLVVMLNGGQALTAGLTDRIVAIDPHMAVFNKNLFPNFKLDRGRIDSIIDNGDIEVITDNWQEIEPDCLQYVIDKSVEMSDIPWLLWNISKFPQGINLPESILVDVAHDSPLLLVELFGNGRFLEARDSFKVMKALAQEGYSKESGVYASDNLLRSLKIYQLKAMLDHRVDPTVLIRLDSLGLLNSDEELIQALEDRPDLYKQASSFSPHVQSWLFKDLVWRHEHPWVGKLAYFDSLEAEDYVFLIDHISDILKGHSSPYSVRQLFKNVKGAVRQQFMDEVEPRLKKFEGEIVEREARNTRRGNQRDLEDEYLNAGNINFGARRYGEQLTDKEIIDGYEIGHCVREAPVFSEMADDPSRINEIECVVSTKDPALENSAFVQDRRVLTEHAALQQLLQFLKDGHNSQPDSGFYSDMIDNLTYIGEKEYAEAVRGIALYWKWFLDKDSEHQLYAGTAVSRYEGRVKSDKYMLDRILGQFSDDEMEKYKGRLLINTDDITQVNPEKVKVVLLDDWTISGSQLKGGYSNFVERNIQLASSIEIQLIAASAERVARGLEELEYVPESGHPKEEHVPIVTRAYFIAHKAHSNDPNSPGARISGSHSTVDFGFGSEIFGRLGSTNIIPGLTHVIRPYRQEFYITKNITRLEMHRRVEEDRVKNHVR